MTKYFMDFLYFCKLLVHPRSQIRQECQQLTRYWNKHGMNKCLDLKNYDSEFNNYSLNIKKTIPELS